MSKVLRVFLTTVLLTVSAVGAISVLLAEPGTAPAPSQKAGQTATPSKTKALPSAVKKAPTVLGALRTTMCTNYETNQCTDYLIQVLDYHWEYKPPTEVKVTDLGRNKVIFVDHDVDHLLEILPLASSGNLVATIWVTGSAFRVIVYRFNGDNVRSVFDVGSRFPPQFINGEGIILIDGGYEMRGNYIMPAVTDVWQWKPSEGKFVSRAMVPVTQKFATVAKILGEKVELVRAAGVLATVRVGKAPRGMAVNPLTNKIYVAVDGSITVMDGTTNATKDIPDATTGASASPFAVAVNPVTNRVYAANLFQDTVTVVDGSTDEVIATVPTGRSPTALAVNPTTNRIYVANDDGNTITVIDGATDRDVATIPVGPNPDSVAVNPVTNKVYVGNENFVGGGPGNVMVIDGRTNKAVATLNKGPMPFGIAVNSKTNKVYVVGSYLGASGAIAVIDGTTGSTSRISLPSLGLLTTASAVAVNPVSNKIYAASDNYDTVFVVDGSTGDVVATIDAGPTPHAVAVDPVTDKIYVANYDSNTVTVIDGTPAQKAARTVSAQSPQHSRD